jgi:hypothetical protein
LLQAEKKKNLIEDEKNVLKLRLFRNEIALRLFAKKAN